MAAIRRHARARSDNARAEYAALSNGAAQREDGIVRRAKIGHGREARHQRRACILRTAQRRIRFRQRDFFEDLVRPELAGQMHVAIDEARKHKAIALIDHRRAFARHVARFDRKDVAVGADQNGSLGQHPPVRSIRQQAPRVNDAGDLRRLLLCEARTRQQSQSRRRSGKRRRTLHHVNPQIRPF
jgi:hypothetical protein